MLLRAFAQRMAMCRFGRGTVLAFLIILMHRRLELAAIRALLGTVLALGSGVRLEVVRVTRIGLVVVSVISLIVLLGARPVVMVPVRGAANRVIINIR